MYVLSRSIDKTVIDWNMETKKAYCWDSDNVNSVAISGDGRIIV
jgi:hypothetical protein